MRITNPETWVRFVGAAGILTWIAGLAVGNGSLTSFGLSLAVLAIGAFYLYVLFGALALLLWDR